MNPEKKHDARYECVCMERVEFLVKEGPRPAVSQLRESHHVPSIPRCHAVAGCAVRDLPHEVIPFDVSADVDTAMELPAMKESHSYCFKIAEMAAT
jgi:hypothetical protein